jgi:transaldolase
MNKKIYLDSANLNEIEELGGSGLIKGVTTNPSLIAKEPKEDFQELIKKIANYCNTENLSLSVEVFTNEPNEIITQATKLWKDLGEVIEEKNLAIKVPVSFENLKAIKSLVESGISINTTCCFSTNQMFLASILESKYASLFYCRLRDNNENPDLVLNETQQIYSANEVNTQIIAGSIRTPEDALRALTNGANIVTTSFNTIVDMTKHTKTNDSIEGFLKDFENWMT